MMHASNAACGEDAYPRLVRCQHRPRNRRASNCPLGDRFAKISAANLEPIGVRLNQSLELERVETDPHLAIQHAYRRRDNSLASNLIFYILRQG